MKVLIIEAGNFLSEIGELACMSGYNDIAFIDDNSEKTVLFPVIGAMKDIKDYRLYYKNVIVAMGDKKNRFVYHTFLDE